MEKYQKELRYFYENVYFRSFLLLSALLGYGYTTIHPTVNADTLGGDFYVGAGQRMIASGRFGMTFWSRLFGYEEALYENGFGIALLGIVLFILAAVNFCILFRRVSEDKLSMASYTIFSVALITYPLIAEIWEYQACEVYIGGGMFFVSLALLLIEDQCQHDRLLLPNWMGAAALLCIVCAGYESVVAVYIFMVFAALLIQEYRNPDWKKHLRQGLLYCLALALGLILKVIVQKALLVILDVAPAKNGAREILWLVGDSLGVVLKNLVVTVLNRHFLEAIVYDPLLEMVICAGLVGIGMIWLFCRKRIFAGLLALGMLVSVEAMSILMGDAAHYRTCQVFGVLVAFCFMLLANIPYCRKTVVCALGLVCILQGMTLDKYAMLNDMRYREEALVIEKIGTQLLEKTDIEKPVYFMGKYRFNDSIMKNVGKSQSFRGQVYSRVCENIQEVAPDWVIEPFGAERYTNGTELQYPVTNVRSVLNWSRRAFLDESMMRKLFAHFGYDIKTTEPQEVFHSGWNDAVLYGIQNPMPGYPDEGYIVELEDKIIVNLG